MDSPKISVVMAVYNGEEKLCKTIESVLNQTYQNFELVIIDDCSTDATTAVIKSSDDPRIVTIRNATNIGQTRSLNIGFAHSRGLYIARTDAGDVSFPKRFEKQVAYLDEHLDVAVVGSGAVRFDPRGKVIDVVHMPQDILQMRQKAVTMGPLIHISTMMRKGVIMEVGGYYPGYDISADFELWSKLLRGGYRLANIQEVLAGYEVSTASFGSINRSNKVFKETSQIMQSNILAFAKRSVSLKQAEDLYRFFMLDLDMLTRDEIAGAACLYTEVMATLAMSRRDVHYHLLRKYIKYFFNHLRAPWRRDLWYVVRALLGVSDGFFSRSGIADDLNRKWQGVLWRRTKNIWNY
ncbi:glycosyltransferase [Candidatus Uhrbacteria bacterium]|nr:glycosyltransferase [Candidatus Uhrbacteria bacterium]